MQVEHVPYMDIRMISQTKGGEEMANERDLLTIADVADHLGCARSYAYRLVQTGEIPSLKIGKLRRIMGQDFDSYIERLRREQGLPLSAPQIQV